MSKHVSADQKLRASLAGKTAKSVSKSQLKHASSVQTGPPAGTNSKNQFR